MKTKTMKFGLLMFMLGVGVTSLLIRVLSSTETLRQTQPQLSVEITDELPSISLIDVIRDVEFPVSGNTITYTLNISVSGEDLLEDVKVREYLPFDVKFVGVSANTDQNWECVSDETIPYETVICRYGELLPVGDNMLGFVVSQGEGATSLTSVTVVSATTSPILTSQ